MRWLFLATLALALSACGGETPVQPTPAPLQSAGPPVVTTTAPVTPSVVTPPVAAPTEPGTVEGRAFAFTSAAAAPTPIPNLRLRVRTGAYYYEDVGGTPVADIVTDASGRYRLTGLPVNEVLVIEPAPGSEYEFICPSYPLFTDASWREFATLPLIHATTQLDRLPAPGLLDEARFWVPGNAIVGTVTERQNGQLVPISGATVTLDGRSPVTANVHGFFVICSVDRFARGISASKTGYQSVTRVIDLFDSLDFNINFELPRQ